MENKSKDWINEIKSFKTDQIKQVTENFEKNIQKVKDELEDVQMSLTRTQFKLDEEIQLRETLKNKFDVSVKSLFKKESKRELNDYISMSAYRDNIITSQNEVIFKQIIIKS